MNACAKWALPIWRANLDFQIPTSWFGVLTYLTKYITKDEPRSAGGNALLSLDKNEPTSSATG